MISSAKKILSEAHPTEKDEPKCYEKSEADCKTNRMTTAHGHPVDDDNNSLTIGPYGPILLQDAHLLDKYAHFDRERVPERVVHAKGAGAHGYFEVTHDITRYCKAKIFERVGKRTEVFVRFSTVISERGSPDSKRDPRGFAIKHYTEDGIWDMVGNNTPVFFVRDPLQFIDFIHSQKRNPQTNLIDANSFWDFLSRVPESIHQLTLLFTDRGTPYNYRQMHGFGNHTFKFVNARGVPHWVKLHYLSDTGIRNLTDEQARYLSGEDGDSATKDLFNHLASGNTASWTMYIQVIPYDAVKNYRWNIFDITKVVPHGDYPLIPVGKLVLNRNPENYFAEVEQAGFSPSNMVPGIEASPDRMLQARLFAYNDTQRHRIGANFTQVPINCPRHCKVANGERDGPMTVDKNGGAASNYEPNYLGAPAPDPSAAIHSFNVSGEVGRWPMKLTDDDFEQVRVFYRRVLSDEDRSHLIHNIVRHMSAVVMPNIVERMIEIFNRVDPDYGKRVAEGLAAVHKSET